MGRVERVKESFERHGYNFTTMRIPLECKHLINPVFFFLRDLYSTLTPQLTLPLHCTDRRCISRTKSNAGARPRQAHRQGCERMEWGEICQKEKSVTHYDRGEFS